jgi:hypothetical protein
MYIHSEGKTQFYFCKAGGTHSSHCELKSLRNKIHTNSKFHKVYFSRGVRTERAKAIALSSNFVFLFL